MGFRQVELLLHTVAQAHAQPLAATEGDQRLGQLVAGTELVGPGVGKGDQTRHPVGLRLHQDGHRRHRQHHHQGEAEQPDPTQEQHRGGGAHHHHRGPEVGLHQQQASHGQQHDERLEETHPAFAYFFLTAHQVACEVDHHEHLGDFRRLHVERAEADPAHRTIHLAANARHDHHHQQAERTNQHQPTQTLPGGNRDHHGDDAGAEADHQIHQVTDHHVQRVARLHGSHFGGRRGDHHQAQAEQRQATGEHREIKVNAAPGNDRRRVGLDDVSQVEAHAKASTARANSWPRSS